MTQIIQGLIIPADMFMPVEKIEFDQQDISAIQGVVHGMFDVIDTTEPAAAVWFNDDGRLETLDPNPRATIFLWGGNSDHRGYTQLRGDVLLTGTPDGDGNTMSLSSDLMFLIMDTHAYRAEIKFEGQDSWRASKKQFDEYWDALYDVLCVAVQMNNVTGVRVIAA